MQAYQCNFGVHVKTFDTIRFNSNKFYYIDVVFTSYAATYLVLLRAPVPKVEYIGSRACKCFGFGKFDTFSGLCKLMS